MPAQPVPTPSVAAVSGAPYSPAVRAGEWVVVSGQLGLDPATGKLVAGGVEAEARQVMANLGGVLADVGAQRTDIAKATVFVADLADFGAINAIYAEFFGEHRPARSTVQVAALPLGGQVEIEVWVHQPG
jgi:2-iminobutanoate/2-iminopropanoate deaminase